ncbi:MAG: methyltransferase domain-containing protein [Candidatus Neptunochlamydia sp.]|nr:methyltransferase domain-containing protein [Candidatus Neptunochlamydia sp.]
MIQIWNMVKYMLNDRRLQKEVKKRYYHDHSFSSLDRAILTAYIFKNPYTISKNYLKNRNEKEIHTYGETPLMTYEKIAQEAEIEPTDTFLELGSGRGRGVLFLHHFFKCQVIGIERIPQFVKLSQYLSHKYHQGRVTFICADMLKGELPEATVVYLYGTALTDQEITTLVQKLKRYPKGTKIISISYPLTDYDENAFQIEKTFPVSFLWGGTEAYVQKVCYHQ